MNFEKSDSFTPNHQFARLLTEFSMEYFLKNQFHCFNNAITTNSQVYSDGFCIFFWYQTHLLFLIKKSCGIFVIPYKSEQKWIYRKCYFYPIFSINSIVHTNNMFALHKCRIKCLLGVLLLIVVTLVYPHQQ